MKDTIRDRGESLEVIVCTHEYEILDEIRESSISDDEEPGDWTGYSLLLVRLSVLGAARGATLATSASGHQLERLQRSVGVSRRAGRGEHHRFETFASADVLRDARRKRVTAKHTGINYNYFICLFICLLGI